MGALVRVCESIPSQKANETQRHCTAKVIRTNINPCQSISTQRYQILYIIVKHIRSFQFTEGGAVWTKNISFVESRPHDLGSTAFIPTIQTVNLKVISCVSRDYLSDRCIAYNEQWDYISRRYIFTYKCRVNYKHSNTDNDASE